MENGRLTGGMECGATADCEPGKDRISRSGLFPPRSQQEPEHRSLYIQLPKENESRVSSPSRTTHEDTTGANG